MAHAVTWTPPTSTEIGTVVKSGLAAGISWPLAEAATGVKDPVLAALTALVVVQVSVRASIFTALQRSAAVVLGVFVALVLGDLLTINGVTVAVLVAAGLGVAQLLLRLPPAAARQVPISGLLVLTAAAVDPGSFGGLRALDTLVGAGVGVVVSVVLPASRRVDARQTVDRLARNLGDVLEAMGRGLAEPWSATQAGEWRRTARAVRGRLVDQATEAVGTGRESARWNVRDRRHVEELARYEEVLPRLERTALGASVISRGLDDYAHLATDLRSDPPADPAADLPTDSAAGLAPGAEIPPNPGAGTSAGPPATPPSAPEDEEVEDAAPTPTTPAMRAMPAMGDLLVALAGAVRAVGRDVLAGSGPDGGELGEALAEVRVQRQRCVRGASRRARLALQWELDAEHGTADRPADGTAVAGEPPAAADPAVAGTDAHHSTGGDGALREGEWLNYAALLVQVDRIVSDLSAPLPA